MKTLKKMMALMIAVVMCMAMTVTAFAGSGATNAHVITVKNSDEIGPHTYEAYQVFVGDYDTTSNKLTNITWGEGVKGTDILNAVKADTATFGADAANAASAEDVAALLGTGIDTPAAKKFAEIVGENLVAANAKTSTKGDEGYVINVNYIMC